METLSEIKKEALAIFDKHLIRAEKVAVLQVLATCALADNVRDVEKQLKELISAANSME